METKWGGGDERPSLEDALEEYGKVVQITTPSVGPIDTSGQRSRFRC